MKKNLLKTVVAGSLTAVLAVGIMLPASASAAEVSTYKATIKLTDATSLKTLLEKWMKDNGITVSNGQVVQKPAAQPETTKPETTKPSQPTQEEKPAATPTKKPENSSNSGNANNTGKTGNNSSNSGNESTQSDFAAQVVKLVNAERAKAGLSALASDALLDKVALAKAKDMSNNNYFDHQSPTYGSPFDMMKQFGVTYSYAGENIAKGQKTPQEVVTAWMNSEGHRANILSKNFTQIGVGYYNGYWAQEFIGK
ncbi:CAP domain-containing protein [Paenibacillus xylanilyticus]|uniref:CAP domain-containing protein n=1 Tax=Paenibacillus xylanilyticus TaxID=248903 RepID=UPI00129D7BF8|nr:CAP domain-containing protein [Paenibacillus xylanilyticus]